MQHVMVEEQEASLGLRERKKAQTRQDLAAAARRLVRDRGYDAVTVADIAADANVSTRTFFNYFPSKEAAIVGLDPKWLEETTAEVIGRPARETPAVALVRTLAQVGSQVDVEGWMDRVALAGRYPNLLSTHLAAMSAVEDALVLAVATRTGISPAADPRPGVMVAAAVATMRRTFTWWANSDRSRPLDEVLTDAFAYLTSGLELR